MSRCAYAYVIDAFVSPCEIVKIILEYAVSDTVGVIQLLTHDQCTSITYYKLDYITHYTVSHCPSLDLSVSEVIGNHTVLSWLVVRRFLLANTHYSAFSDRRRWYDTF